MHQNIKKLANIQALAFWGGIAFSVSLLAGFIVLLQDKSTIVPPFVLPTAMSIQLIIGVIFIVTSGLLASAVKKSAVVWVLVPTFLGPIGFILAYAMLSSTAKKTSQNS
jgi:hypothetical protein